jgi:hypothetical protein
MNKGQTVFEGSVEEFLTFDFEEYGVKTPDFVRISKELGLKPVKSIRELLDVLKSRGCEHGW